MLFLYSRTNIWIRRQAFPVYNMASSGLKKMFYIILRHLKGVWENVMTNNIFILIFVYMTILTPLVTIGNFNNVWREDQNLHRWIKEALFIRVNNPSFNKNIGKYHLPHRDKVLLNNPELKLE